jgi:multidrug efflux pump subunit AcrB
VFINPQRLAAHGLTVEDVDKALADADPAELAKTVVGKTKIAIRLSDVATVVTATPPTDVTFNERPATIVAIYTNRKANLDELRQAIADLAKSLPAGASVSIVADLTREKYVYAQATAADGSSQAKWNRAKDGLRRVIAIRPENMARLAFSDPFTGEFRCLIQSTDVAATRKSLGSISSAKIRTDVVGADRGRVPFPTRIALTGPDRAALQQWSKAVATGLAKEPTFSEIEAESVELQLRSEIKTDAAAMSRLGLRADDIEKSITLLAGGSVTAPHAVLSLVPTEAPAQRLSQLKVRDRSGNFAPMSAFVSIETKTEPRSLRTVNGQPALRITASPVEGQSSADAVQKMIKIAKTAAAPGEDYRIIDDTITAP